MDAEDFDWRPVTPIQVRQFRQRCHLRKWTPAARLCSATLARSLLSYQRGSRGGYRQSAGVRPWKSGLNDIRPGHHTWA